MADTTLDGWVMSADRTWCGKLGITRPDGATVIEPAYTVIGGDMVGLDQAGNCTVAPIVLQPLLGFASGRKLLAFACVCMPLDDLDPQDAARIKSLIAGAEQARIQMRAQRSGLVVAGSMPRGQVAQ